jgi:FkbM family methyltransferase
MASLILHYSPEDANIGTLVGQKVGKVISIRSNDAGYGLFGPYVTLPAGPGVGRVRFASGARGRVRATLVADAGATSLASLDADLAAMNDSILEIIFELHKPLGSCELQLFCEADVSAEIVAIELELQPWMGVDGALWTANLGTWVIAEPREGLRLWIDLGDTGVSRNCLLGDYEPVETAFIEGFLKPGMAFIDIGANIGWYSVLAAKRVGPQGRVYSFEPRPDTCGALRKSLAENGFDHARVSQLALSDSPGRLIVASQGNSPGGTWLLTTEALNAAFPASAYRYDVEVARLDDLPIERCDLLKIDVEGAEYRALSGARQTLSRLKPVILSEVNPSVLKAVSGVSVAEYLALLFDIGYTAHEVTPDGPGLPLGEAFAQNPPEMSNIALLPGHD